jgi:hypothetical protein
MSSSQEPSHRSAVTAAIIGGIFTVVAALITVVVPALTRQAATLVAPAGTPTVVGTVTALARADQPSPTRESVAAAPTLTATSGATPVVHGGYSRRNPPSPAPLGWPIERDGVQLTLIKADVYGVTEGPQAAMRLYFALMNKSTQRLLVEFDRSAVYAEDAEGTRYVDWEGSQVDSFSLEPGRSVTLVHEYSTAVRKTSRVPPSAMPITAHVGSLSRIQDAEWIVGGEPIRTYREGDAAGAPGETFTVGLFEITLTDLEVLTTQGAGNGAFRARFDIRNGAAQAQLLELDFAHVHVEDNLGNRYNDWEGPGFVSIRLDSGREFQVRRTYATEYRGGGPAPVGLSYAVVVVEGLGDGTRIQWRVPIVR